jgi:hypothetical protein
MQAFGVRRVRHIVDLPLHRLEVPLHPINTH